MAQAKRKTATKTAKKKTTTARRTTGARTQKQTQMQEQGSNMFFVISMSVLAATLLFANLLMMVAQARYQLNKTLLRGVFYFMQ